MVDSLQPQEPLGIQCSMQALEGRLGSIISAPDLATLPMFGIKLHRGLEKVYVKAYPTIQFCQLAISPFSLKGVIADQLPDYRPILCSTKHWSFFL